MPDPLARLIDFALLHPTLSDAELRDGLRRAVQLGVASVCIKPYAVPLAVELLRGSEVAVGTVVGFPQGSAATAVKSAEARLACEQGATELDMVVNVGKVLSEDWDYVEQEIRAVVEAARPFQAIVKVIFENDFLPRDELKIRLCEICGRVGASFVKTSTGFGFVKQPSGDYNYRGATRHDVELMRKHSPTGVGIKAAGGVRTREEALEMQRLGCTRIGTSAPEAMLEQDNVGAEAGY